MSHHDASLSNGGISTITDARADEETPGVGPDDPAALAIRRGLLEAHRRLSRDETATAPGAAEGVHQMRTAARRLRSQLRLFGELIEGDWADSLASELKWLGRQLGAVRDDDVLLHRLGDDARDLSDALGPLFEMLTERRASASAALDESLRGERYLALLGGLSTAAEQSPFRDAAWEPCRKALPRLARRAWKRLRSAGRALDLSDSDDEYHEVRKRAKHARYTGELASASLDSDSSGAARRFAQRARAVQDILGEHQDAITAVREIQRIAAERADDGPFNLAAGRLLERLDIAACDGRSKFFKAWHKFDRKKNRTWMKA
jgi:CHAD domain-containing protein